MCEISNNEISIKFNLFIKFLIFIEHIISDANVTVLRDNDNTFKGLYFSTKDMRDSMAAWPEIVFIDGTYKLLASDLTLILHLVEDSNGLSEIASVALTVHEDTETFRAILECFRTENLDTCEKIKCFKADKDLLERDLLKEIFKVPVYIYTLKIFSREITKERIGKSLLTRQEILKMLEALAYSPSEEVYAAKYSEFSTKAPKKVLEYYNENWHPIKNEWTVFSMACGNLSNRTNNRMESINNKIKQVVPKRSTLVCFLENFFEWLNSHKYERDHKAVQHVLKRPVTIFAPESCEFRYLEYVTNYAFKFVIDSIESSKSIKTDKISKSTDEQFEVKTGGTTFETSIETCNCSYWTSMLLPCNHIFAIRTLEGLPLFAEHLVDFRWTQKYYLQTQRTFRGTQTTPNSPASVKIQTTPQRILTLSEKRKRASFITSSLVTLTSIAPLSQYQCKLQVLKDIERLWKQGFEVAVEKIESHRSGPSTSFGSNDDDVHTLLTIPEISEETEHALAAYETEVGGNASNENASSEGFSSSQTFNIDSTVSSATVINQPTNIEIQNRESDTTTELLSSNNRLSSTIVKRVLDEIIMPVSVRVRGRPKGATLTVIGLKRTRVKGTASSSKSSVLQSSSSLIPFKNRHVTDQVETMLGWCVTKEKIPHSLSGKYLIKESDVEQRPEFVNNEILDENAKLHLLQKYMDEDAFHSILKTVQIKRKTAVWMCSVCNVNVDGKSVVCDVCLKWYHYTCVGFNRAPRTTLWFCPVCLKK